MMVVPNRRRASAKPAVPDVLVNGLRVIKDEQFNSPLKKPNGDPVPFTGYRLWTLEDKSTTLACADCGHTGTRKEIHRHRYHAHGAGRPGRRPTKPPEVEQAESAADLLTIGEVRRMALDSVHWGDLLAAQTVETEEWKQRALVAEQWRRKVTQKLAQLGFKMEEDDE